VAGEAHPRAMTTWTPACGVRVHARLLRPPGRAEGTIVMLHGLGVSAASLGPLAEQLAHRSLVLVCDLPGFGRTRDDAIWGIGALAEVVEELLERRGLGRVTLVGHSWGCHVAAVLAARHPARVGALVMLSPAFDRRGGAAGQILRLAVDAPMERPSLVAGGARDYLRAGPARVIGTLREAVALPLDEIVAAVRAPVLIVRGGRDPLTTGRWAGRIAGRACRARVAVIPGAAHGLGHDAPVAVAAAIGAFLAGEGHRPRMPPSSPARPDN
jgi:pimeloyl-ACP methyl ester carboxylesterase